MRDIIEQRRREGVKSPHTDAQSVTEMSEAFGLGMSARNRLAKRVPFAAREADEDRLWGQLMSDEFRKYKDAQQMEKMANRQKNQEIQAYLKNQI